MGRNCARALENGPRKQQLFWCRYFKPDATSNAAWANTATFIPSQLDCSQTARNSARLWVWVSHPNGLKSKYAYSSSKESWSVHIPLNSTTLAWRRFWSKRASLIRDFLVSSSALIHFLTTTLLLSGSFAVKTTANAPIAISSLSTKFLYEKIGSSLKSKSDLVCPHQVSEEWHFTLMNTQNYLAFYSNENFRGRFCYISEISLARDIYYRTTEVFGCVSIQLILLGDFATFREFHLRSTADKFQ